MWRVAEEEKWWIKVNAHATEWDGIKEFVAEFNKKFNKSLSYESMNTYLYRHKIRITSKFNTNHWTAEQDKWLRANITMYGDFVGLAKEFNKKFKTERSNCCVAKHCQRAGMYVPTPKQPKNEAEHKACDTSLIRNKGRFVKGVPNGKGLPVGTIRYNSDGRPFIKVLADDGKNCRKDGGHNYREPYWKPLQKKIWEDHYGEVPKGYIVCSLNNNPNDTDINNIGIVLKSCTPIMAKRGWWTDETEITRTATKWCDLFNEVKPRKTR